MFLNTAGAPPGIYRDSRGTPALPPPPNSLCGRRRRASHIASLTHCVGGFAHVTRTQPRRRGGRRNRALLLGYREALPPGGTSLNLSERHARARPHDGGRGGARGGPPPVMNRAGRSPNPNPSYTGTSYGHVPGVKVVSRCVRRSWAGHRAFAQRHPSQKLPEPENSVFLNTPYPPLPYCTP